MFIKLRTKYGHKLLLVGAHHMRPTVGNQRLVCLSYHLVGACDAPLQIFYTILLKKTVDYTSHLITYSLKLRRPLRPVSPNVSYCVTAVFVPFLMFLKCEV